MDKNVTVTPIPITELEYQDTIPSFLSDNLGLPAFLHPQLSSLLHREEHSTGRQASAGCSDIYSVFAFLAFLFALLDFLLNMMEKRKRRAAENEEECSFMLQHSSDMDMRESTLAVYAMMRGLLNSLDTVDEEGGHCTSWSVCEAAREAGRLGRYGVVIAVLGSSKAGWVVERMGRGSWEGVRRAGIVGVRGGDCDQTFPCHDRSQHYRPPGVQGDHTGERGTNKYVQIFRKVVTHYYRNNINKTIQSLDNKVLKNV